MKGIWKERKSIKKKMLIFHKDSQPKMLLSKCMKKLKHKNHMSLHCVHFSKYLKYICKLGSKKIKIKN